MSLGTCESVGGQTGWGIKKSIWGSQLAETTFVRGIMAMPVKYFLSTYLLT